MRRHRRFTARLATCIVSDHNDIVALWLIRAVLRTKEGAAWLRELDDFPPFLHALVEHARTPGKKPRHLLDDKPLEVRATLRAQLRRLEKEPPAADGVVFRNADRLAEMLELNPVERDILAFAACVRAHETLKEFFQMAPGFSDPLSIVATMLGQEPSEIRAALGARGALLAGGLARFPAEYSDTGPVELMTGLAEIMCRDYESDDDLLRRFFRPSPPATLALGDFPHLAEQSRLLASYLESVCGDRPRGTNIMLYGPPGTGKTELARALAHETGVELFEVPTSDEEGEPRHGLARVQAYQLCQRLLRNKKSALVLFDEAEDVFPDSPFPFYRRHAPCETKGWINRVLEGNPLPAIWISNAVQWIDPAYLRRFDIALEVGQPPRSVRRKILQNHLGDLPVAPKELDRLVEANAFSPADAEKTARVLRRLSGPSAPDLDRAIRVLAEERLKVRGQRQRPRRPAPRIPFDLSLISTTADLAVLAESLKQRPTGSLCFYGPPGTGKTEFAHFLAKSCDLPIVIKRASDLLGMFVGETEHNIAAMFEEARREKALLLLDEADSFLQDRRGAQRSWEVTQVNELLVQMENFEGLFVCSTNLMDSLDQASLRRFTFKLKFDYLRPDQRWRMFEAALDAFGVPAPAGEDLTFAKTRLDTLRRLTPGDFAVVAKQHTVTGEINGIRAVVAALEAEVAAKPEARRERIGF